MHYYKFLFVFVAMLLATTGYAQEKSLDSLNTLPPDTTQSLITDSINDDGALRINVKDSLQNKNLAAQDTVESDIETTINYNAEDSILVDNESRSLKLYGNAVVTYGEIKLEAAEIILDWNNNTVTANGRLDTAGNLVGQPVFTEGSQVYETKQMSYNFDSKKAVISGVVTQQGEAFMHAGKIKKDQNDVVYGSNLKYTTCNLPDPHFHIAAKKFKKLPGGATLVGPFDLYVNDVPTPLGFLFGMFPNKRERASGVVIPTYGEERRRGFFLRNGGYYFAISDYLDLSVLGEVYSKGSFGATLASTYKKRYAYDGQFDLSYNFQKLGNVGELEQESRDIWLKWDHRPVQRGNSRFSASVSAGTSSFNANNPTNDFNRNIRQEFMSTVSYNKIFKGTPFSLGLASRFNQNVATGVATLTFPDIALNMQRIYPFKNLPGKSSSWYKKIFFGQDFRYSRKMSNVVVQRDPETGDPLLGENNRDSVRTLSFFNDFGTIWRNAETQQSEAQPLSFDFPVSTSFKVFKYFTLSPTINYSQRFYFKKQEYFYNDTLRRFTDSTRNGFYSAFTTSTNLLLATNIFGFFNPPSKSIERIRHVMTPEIRFNYTPDLSQSVFGLYETYTNPETDQIEFLPRFRGAPSRGARGSLGFAINNNIEMKILNKEDSTGKNPTRKVPLLENLSFSSGYNFLADSFQLENINIAARTKLFKNKIDINLRATIDPYIYILTSPITENSRGDQVVRQRRVSRLAWTNGNGLGQITSANLAINANLNPAVREKQAEVDRGGLNSNEQAMLDEIENNPDLYVDFNIPWNFRVNYSLNYRRQGFQESDITQSIRFDGDVSLTEKWKITVSSGYDLKLQEFVQTNINIHRDLHCFEMRFTWIPIGRFQSYSLTINAKSSLLQDLKLNRQKSWRDR